MPPDLAHMTLLHLCMSKCFGFGLENRVSLWRHRHMWRDSPGIPPSTWRICVPYMDTKSEHFRSSIYAAYLLTNLRFYSKICFRLYFEREKKPYPRKKNLTPLPPPPKFSKRIWTIHRNGSGSFKNRQFPRFRGKLSCLVMMVHEGEGKWLNIIKINEWHHLPLRKMKASPIPCCTNNVCKGGSMFFLLFIPF